MDSCRIPLKNFPDPIVDAALAGSPLEKTAILGGGCFWCVEAVFREFDGVSPSNGYAGRHRRPPQIIEPSAAAVPTMPKP